MFTTNQKLFNHFKKSSRYCWLTGEESANGSIFLNPVGEVEDLSDVKILHKGIDTIKQRYNGTLSYQFVKRCYDYLEAGYWNQIVQVCGEDFLLTRGGASRYRFKLQAKALGVVILFGHDKLKIENICDEGKGMIKYEISPHFIYKNGLERIEYMLSAFNQEIMESFTASGFDIHLAVDVQGWKPDESMINDMVTMTHKEPVMHNGIDDNNFNHSSSAVRYGRLDSIRWGNHGTSELEIYNKTMEATATGKTTFWNEVYNTETVYYDESTHVYRIELRLPSSVLKNLVQRDDGTPLLLLDIPSVSEHLNTLWRYGLSRLFRYDYPKYSKNEKTVKPIWQLLLDDVYFNDHFFPVDYKQIRVTVDDSIDKNITLAMGNLSTALAKAGCTEEQYITTVQSMPIYNQLLEYAQDKKELTEENYIQYLKDVFKVKTIEYNRRAEISKDRFNEYRRNYKRSQELTPGYASY